jgi:hypothetical protein
MWKFSVVSITLKSIKLLTLERNIGYVSSVVKHSLIAVLFTPMQLLTVVTNPMYVSTVEKPFLPLVSLKYMNN